MGALLKIRGFHTEEQRGVKLENTYVQNIKELITFCLRNVSALYLLTSALRIDSYKMLLDCRNSLLHKTDDVNALRSVVCLIAQIYAFSKISSRILLGSSKCKCSQVNGIILLARPAPSVRIYIKKVEDYNDLSTVKICEQNLNSSFVNGWFGALILNLGSNFLSNKL